MNRVIKSSCDNRNLEQQNRKMQDVKCKSGAKSGLLFYILRFYILHFRFSKLFPQLALIIFLFIIMIFTSPGMAQRPTNQEFVQYAKSILSAIEGIAKHSQRRPFSGRHRKECAVVRSPFCKTWIPNYPPGNRNRPLCF